MKPLLEFRYETLVESTDETPNTITLLNALKFTFMGLIYKEVFTDTDVYQFLTWVPKLQAP